MNSIIGSEESGRAPLGLPKEGFGVGAQAGRVAKLFDGIVVDFRLRIACRGKRPVGLTVREFALLDYLIRHEGEVVSREMILRDVWGYDMPPSTRSVDNYILALRRKLGEKRGKPRHLLTVPTAGYRFVRA